MLLVGIIWAACLYADDLVDIKSFIAATKKISIPIKKPPVNLSAKLPTYSVVHRTDLFNSINNTPLQSEIILLHYAIAENIAKLLSDKSANFLSNEGRVIADIQNNRLIIFENNIGIHRIKELLKKLDVPTPQVLIKAQIITVDNNFIRSLGIIFSQSKHKSIINQGLNMDFPETETQSNTIHFPLVRFYEGSTLDMEITALENEGHARLISTPEVVTLNRTPAIIESGEEIPYQESTYSGGTSVVFKKAVLQLKVTPQILPDNRILLQINVNQDKVSPLIVNGTPVISTQQIQTQVSLRNEQTIVLGGIFEQEISHQQTGIPGLRKVPLLGKIFQQNKQANNLRQLMIFITPKILT